MRECAFYLVSTPLHLFLSSAIALQHSDKKNILIFIDQAEVEDNFYLQQINLWESSPFEEVHIFPGRIKGLLKKRSSRQKTFKQLAQLIAEFKPTDIHIGNDRRIEFQYCMHRSQQYGGAKGHYIDEGTYTYIGREQSQSFQDAIVDNWVKKLVYGMWWKNPITIGGSDWISSIYVAFPKLIHPLLKQKEVVAIDPEWLESPSLNEFSKQLLSAKGMNSDTVSAVDVLIALPHESIIAQNQMYKSSILNLIIQLKEKNKNVAVKYHPRDSQVDALNLQEAGCQLIPSQVNFEALLLIFPKNRTIIGDFSSVLLNARWLRPDLKVIAALENKASISKLFSSLYSSLEIDMVNVEDIHTLKNL
ncbi:MAG: hypothetical protein JKY50_14585 [Oleispira sp.]|nr:hypothetical protein [Oleispira sp.]MBL4882544.1 hypothetical protein [Oleispira sp.]